MASGPMRHRVTLQQYTHTVDAYGGVAEGWTDEVTVWASVEPVGGKTFFEARQAQSEVTHRVRIRNFGVVSGIRAAGWRLTLGDQVYSITAAMPNNRRSEIVLLCALQSSRQQTQQAQQEASNGSNDNGSTQGT